jgi:hypothetical protein
MGGPVSVRLLRAFYLYGIELRFAHVASPGVGAAITIVRDNCYLLRKQQRHTPKYIESQ